MITDTYNFIPLIVKIIFKELASSLSLPPAGKKTTFSFSKFTFAAAVLHINLVLYFKDLKLSVFVIALSKLVPSFFD